jgi:hypothetical protein
LLWVGFKNHLNESWDLYATFGTNLEEACEQIKFSEAVVQQMVTDFKDQGINFEPLNHLTLYNYFKTDGFSLNAKTKTLNTFSAFIGYQNWSAFREKVEKGEITSQAFPYVHDKAPKPGEGGQPPRMPGSKWLNLFIFMTALALLSYFIWHHFEETKDEKERIEKAIKAANAAEFNAYMKIPAIDSNTLKKHFVESGTAYNTIVSVLLRSQRRNRKLLVPPSSYVVNDIEVTELDVDQAEAESEEHWVIRWYDGITDSEMLFDTINRHIYYLLKEDGKWKVQVDAYSGRSRKPASTFAKKK